MSAAWHKPNEYQRRLLAPMCRQYGHLFVRDSFLGIPVGKPYCMRCGAAAFRSSPEETQ